MPRRSTFVCAINRNRDGYQVPLALEEAGLLEAFVTDFYADPSWDVLLPAILRRRRIAGLGSDRVRSDWPAFVLQSAAQVLNLPMRHVYRAVGSSLGRKALRIARRRNAALYCYAGHFPDFEKIPKGMKLIDFEFHPHPQLGWEILSADAATFPEVAWSFAHEEQQLRNEDFVDGWSRADAIVCASRMTRRSLEHVGCPAERITVIPYAIDPPSGTVAQRPSGPCRFLFVGQGIQRKGLHHLIRCWRELGLKDAELTIVSYVIDPGIAALAEGSNITLLGRQDRARLDALYREADVFVMPSLVEGFGLVYLEALAAGCHVIGTINTGLPDLNLGSGAVTTVPAGDLDALGAALRSCVDAKASGRMDAAQVAAEASRWQWGQFRGAIADHARKVLES